MCGLQELCINNLSPLSFSLCHHLSTLFSLPSASLFSWSLSHFSSPFIYLFCFPLIFFPCRGWSGLAVCPSAAKGVRGGVEGAAVLAVAVVVIVCCSPCLSWWWWPWSLTPRRLKSSELAPPRKKCRSWTLRSSWGARVTSQTGTFGRCGARKTPSTSTWSHCWWTRPTQKASSPTCVTWCPGPRSTVWCSGMAPTRRPSPRFWILFPRRRSYPSWASMEGHPWSWLIRYGGVGWWMNAGGEGERMIGGRMFDNMGRWSCAKTDME